MDVCQANAQSSATCISDSTDGFLPGRYCDCDACSTWAADLISVVPACHHFDAMLKICLRYKCRAHSH
ncbi:hypothetical protein CPter91_1702 [Collimonas pratensis]|uniref:Uncharacterized protein n=1 Tax=Collimonas pratensis TaxID=279113 RepID=A0A127Q2M6_9BURK|nr:hypothetical protein CPter91_1702 [Collimonas pratensis]